MKKLIVALLLIMSIYPAFSQVTGYRGKRFALKTDLISGVRIARVGFDMECVTGRMTSLTFGLRAEQIPGGERLRLNSLETATANPTQSALASLGLRIYTNKIIPSPQGFYFSFEAGLGAEQHTLNLSSFNRDYTVQKASVFFHASAPSMGFQTFIGKRLLFDFKYATELFIVYDDQKYDYKFVKPNLISMKNSRVIIGPSFYVKVGVLL